MMNKLLSFLLAVFLAFTLIGIVSADMSSQTLIYDEAGLLSSNEKSKLEEEAQAIYKDISSNRICSLLTLMMM